MNSRGLADWVGLAGDEEGVPPLVVTSNARAVLPQPLVEVARLTRRTTPRSRLRYEPGPVIVFEPDERAMAFALDLSDGFSLAIVDADPPRWQEWAAARGARDEDGGVVASALAQSHRDELFALLSLGARCGWRGYEFSRRAFAVLRSHGPQALSVETLVATGFAFDLDRRAAQNLVAHLHARTWIA